MLKDKIVIVTGAARGIGRGIADVVASKGASVILLDIEKDTLSATEAELSTKHSGVEFLALKVDITDEMTVAKAFSVAIENFGRIDGLVNNAAVVLDRGILLESDAQQRAKEVDVNVNGVFNCCKAFVQHAMNRGEGGNIVNIASAGGVRAHVLMGHYSSTKAAVINLTQCQSAEWAKYGINVNAVCPGGVRTAMLHAAAEAKTKYSRSKREAKVLMESWVPPQLGRPMEAEEVGYVVAFLLSDEAVLVRGQAIKVDAGYEHEVLEDYFQ